jgi:hypothetical protein
VLDRRRVEGSDTCRLCDLPLAETAIESDDDDPFCCRGCLHVNETLADRDDAAVESGPDALAMGASSLFVVTNSSRALLD